MAFESPKFGLIQEPRLTSAEAWSRWFQFCAVELKEPEFLVARAPTRKAMVEACRKGDLETRRRILEKFREENEQFRRQVRQRLFTDTIILNKIFSSTVVYLCAGLNFSPEFAVLADKLFLIDHAPDIIKHLQREVVVKHSYSRLSEVKALEMSAEQIGSRAAKRHGMHPGTVDSVIAIRGLHRVPRAKRKKALKAAQQLLKPDGIFILVELFEDDRPASRIPTPGAWYWRIEDYQNELTQMHLEVRSPSVFQNQDDSCRLLVFRK